MYDYDLYLSLGELTLTKVAGEIDDDTFDYVAASMVKEAADSTWSKFKRGYVDALKAKDIRKGLKRSWWDNSRDWKRVGKGVLKTTGAYAAPIAAGLAGYGAYKNLTR